MRTSKWEEDEALIVDRSHGLEMDNAFPPFITGGVLGKFLNSSLCPLHVALIEYLRLGTSGTSEPACQRASVNVMLLGTIRLGNR